MDSFNFVQHITSPTHIEGNTLDLIISHVHSNFTNSHSINNLFSDHHLVFFHISSPRPTRPIIKIKYRKYNNIDTDTFITEFSKQFNNTHFSNPVSKVLSKTLDELAPIKYKFIT